MNKTLEASPHTFYDSDESLFRTYVGVKSEKNGYDLYFTAWGATEKESRERAEELVLTLNNGNYIRVGT